MELPTKDYAPDADRTDKYNARVRALFLKSREERAALLLEWLGERVEQHEVFGDEVGTNADYEVLVLCRRIVGELWEHLGLCPYCGDEYDEEGEE